MPSIDHARARRLIAAVPEGRWTSYKDVAIAPGAPGGAQAVGQWRRREGDRIAGVHRVLTIDGWVAEGFVAAGPTVPDSEIEVRRRLTEAGVLIDGHGRVAATQRFHAKEWPG